MSTELQCQNCGASLDVKGQKSSIIGNHPVLNRGVMEDVEPLELLLCAFSKRDW